MSDKILAGLTENNKKYLLYELVPYIIKAQEEPETTTTLTITIRHGEIIGESIKHDRAIKQ